MSRSVVQGICTYRFLSKNQDQDLQSVEFGHTAGVSSAGEPCGDERVNCIFGHLDPDDALTEADDVGIVVLSGQDGKQELHVVNRSSADAVNLVCRHAHPQTGAAHCDTQVCGAFGDGASERKPKSG